MTGESILIVDDNAINLKLAKVTLKIAGYDVHTAIDADDALSILATFQPRLILMDLQLPGMDGLALTRKLKANPQYKNTIILAVTAYAMKGDEEKALSAGCHGYIAKPINTQALPDIVASYFKKNGKK